MARKKKEETVKKTGDTNLYEFEFSDDRFKDIDNLDTSFVDGKLKKKKLSKDLEEAEKERIAIDDVPPKPKKYVDYKRIVIPILFLLVGLIVGFLIAYTPSENNNKEKEEKTVYTVVDDNYLFVGDFYFNQYDIESSFIQTKFVNNNKDDNTTSDILENINTNIYQYNPSDVFILLGVNDLDQGILSSEINDNIKKIIEGIKENRSGAKIHVLSLLPINDSDDEIINKGYISNLNNKEISDTNTLIEKTCELEKVDYIDVYKELVDESGILNIKYTTNGLYLNDVGYQMMTDVLNEYVK
jgi:lysophospholipase L1-like esterase